MRIINMQMTRISTGNYEVSFPISFTLTQAVKGAETSKVKQGTLKAQISQYQPDWSNKALWWSTVEVVDTQGNTLYSDSDLAPCDTLKEAKRYIEILKNKQVVDFYR